MAFSKKEQGLLKDLQNEEKLCAQKYHRAAEAACDPKLKKIFSRIEKAEQGHYDTVTGMLEKGAAPTAQGQGKGGGSGASSRKSEDLKSQASRADKKKDEYLLGDLLATEKYVSSVYNTTVFEFSDPKARQVLAAIQQQEQQHGKEIADYMMANNMYC